MARYLIQLAYNGANYHGWQYQPNATSVQETLTKAIAILCREEVELTGAGRTDTGVHATFFVAHFDLQETLSEPGIFCSRLNGILPNDIFVRQVFPVSEDFHARFSALMRTYRYYLSSGKEPFLKDFTHHCHYKLDIALMNRGAELIKSGSDFTSFSKLHTDVKTNVCKITEACWEEESGHLVFTITADRFLRNMVRAIVGTLIDLGRGKIDLEELNAIMKAKDRGRAGASVPARALFLADVVYPEPVNSFFIRQGTGFQTTFVCY